MKNTHKLWMALSILSLAIFLLASSTASTAVATPAPDLGCVMP